MAKVARDTVARTPDAVPGANSVTRLHIRIRGAVQGVGFRPFVYRLALELGISGWVMNSADGATLDLEASADQLESFLIRLHAEKPPRAFYQNLESSHRDPVGYAGFEIRASDGSGAKTALILPDIATCPECLREILDPNNRRYRYPFTNCTNCGPRFSIITALPYDRMHTTMQKFPMCDACRDEYENPLDRRFHAQPNACPVCGPHVELWDRTGRVLAERDDALHAAAKAVRHGDILALKGLGGFHLIVDARNADAVRRLRHAKNREEKPLALMYPSLAAVKDHCEVSSLGELLLRSPESPIVLLHRKLTSAPAGSEVVALIAPGNPCLGVTLPYTPLHHLLMSELGFPVVATSGNRSDETICTDETEALRRLDGIADYFLVHDRPIARHADDSIVRVLLGRELVLRRARGYAPLPVELERPIPALLAVGGHLKSTVAWSAGRNVFVSQHIGDLETVQALDAFGQVIADLLPMHESAPVAVACDLHPDYLSTRHAESLKLPLVRVQHHHAHVLSCMSENGLRPPVLGVAWDGTGYGTDGTIWGGEFLRVEEESFERVAHFRTFPLPGGDAAVKEPRRTAIGLLYEIGGEELIGDSPLVGALGFAAGELHVLRDMLRRGVNCPRTSSVGRLFDAIAALTGVRTVSRFEGQAAMELEFALERHITELEYTYGLRDDQTHMIIDWEPMVRELMMDISAGVIRGLTSAKFHNMLARIIAGVTQRSGLQSVALSGGCFQNRYLTERSVLALRTAGLVPYWHQRIPPNDGGIALGQIVAAARVVSKVK